MKRVETKGRSPELYQMAVAVSDDIKRTLGRDRRLEHVEAIGLEFLLSMGLLVRDPGERVRVLIEALPFAVKWRVDTAGYGNDHNAYLRDPAVTGVR